ncbi:MAG: sigma-54-dependent Fis family transcriptional regulator, partial [Bacteroidota bacterium]|nr:sigma-54-dependent Fis family transcriptional regulator [Bacteroidota bacterium]
LFYRVNLITVKLPALRERTGDIPLLLDFFLQTMKEVYKRKDLQVTKAASKWIKELPLPGNIRELKNLVERTVLVSPKDTLDVEDFMGQMSPQAKNIMDKTLPAVGTLTLDEMERSMILKTLEHHKSNISKVARSLGISRGALYRRLDKYNIPYEAQE